MGIAERRDERRKRPSFASRQISLLIYNIFVQWNLDSNKISYVNYTTTNKLSRDRCRDSQGMFDYRLQ